jgi:ATP-dependent exoDNAse (exonuclease V) alpha subunit
MKFKVGDRVVRTRDNETFCIKKGMRGVVTKVTEKYVVKYDELPDSHGAFEENLEFDVIYNTPLYHALREK